MRAHRIVAAGVAVGALLVPAPAPARELRAPGRVVLLGRDSVGAPVVTALPDGRIVLAGERAGRPALVRLSAGGTLDRTFGDRGVARVPASGTPAALLPRPGGLALLVDGQAATLVGLTDEGRLDEAFGDAGTVQLGSALRCRSCGPVQALPDGHILTLARAAGRWVVQRLTADGRLDRAFGAGGRARVPARVTPHGLRVFPDGSAAVLGATAAPPPGLALLRLTPTGARDTAFNGGTAVTSAGQTAAAARAAPDGSLHVVTVSGATQQVVRYTATGRVDPAFAGRGAGEPATTGISSTWAVAAPDGGDLLVGSSAAGPFTGGTAPDFTLTRVALDGTTSRGLVRLPFGGGATAPPGPASGARLPRQSGFVPRDVAERPDGSVVVAGSVGAGYTAGAQVDEVVQGTGIAVVDPASPALEDTFGAAAPRTRLTLRVPTQRPGRRVRLRIAAAAPGLCAFAVKAAGRSILATTLALRSGPRSVRLRLSRRGARTLAASAPGPLRASARCRDLIGTPARVSARGRLVAPGP